MELPLSPTAATLSMNVPATADFIASLQKDSGEIPWSQGGKTDPWDHVESAMGLSVAGYHGNAERAYEWLAATSFPTGAGGRRHGTVLSRMRPGTAMSLPTSPSACTITS